MTPVIDFSTVRARKLSGLPAFDNTGLPQWAASPRFGRITACCGWRLDDRVLFRLGPLQEFSTGSIRHFIEATATRASQAHIVANGVTYVVRVVDLRLWPGENA